MRRILVRLVFVAALAASTLGLLAQQAAAESGSGWNAETISIPGISSDWLIVQAMGIDAQGSLNVVVREGTATFYSKLTAAGWQSAETLGPPFEWDSSMDFDGQGRPAGLFYYDGWGSEYYGINYIERTESGWARYRLDSRFWTGKKNSLQIDSQGNRHVAYNSLDGALKYAKRVGQAWTISDIDNSGFWDARPSVSLALDSAGNPAVAYVNQGSSMLRLARWNGSQWQVQDVEPLAGYPNGSGAQVQMVVDGEGNAHIGYLVAASTVGGKIRHAAWNGATWTSETIEEDAYGRVSMAADNGGAIHLTYTVAAGIKYATLQPGATSWNVELVDTVQGEPFIALDANGEPTIINSHVSRLPRLLQRAPRDGLAPTTSYAVTPEPNAARWNKTSVIVNLSAIDEGSGVKDIRYVKGGEPEVVVAGAAAAVAIDAEGETALRYWAVDGAGNVEGAKIAQIKIDKRAPTIGHAQSPAPNTDGWNRTDVTITFTCDDELSRVASCAEPRTVSTEGQNQAVAGTAVDNAGNAAADTALVSIDKTAPTIEPALDRAANAQGWYNATVTVSFTCADALSGIDTRASAQVLGEGANQSAGGSASDRAGNTASATISGINVDQTPPVVTYTGNAGTYTIDQTVDVTCTAMDNLSGVLSSNCQNVSGPAYSFRLGTNTFSAPATDRAGNIGTGSTGFTIAVTYDSLSVLTSRFVTNKGIDNALTAKLRAAEAAAARGDLQARDGQLKAYKNQLAAQSGKAVATENAALLSTLAGAL